MGEFIRRREKAMFLEGSQTINEILTLYFEDRKKEKKSVHVEEKLWLSNLKPVFGDKKPEDINTPVFVNGEERTLSHKYAYDRQKQGARRATIWHELNVIRTGLNWGAKPGRDLNKKIHVWLPRRPKGRDTKLTFEQFLKVLEECQAPHLRLFVILAISTGQRKSAILQLTWDRVDLVRGVINFTVDREQDDILDSGGRKGRSIVEIGVMARRELDKARLGAQTQFVIEYNGSPVLDIHKGLKAAMVRAGVTGKFFGSHALRHSAATWIAGSGVEIRKVQKLLGHEDASTTDRIYAGYQAGYLTSAVNVVDGVLAREPKQLAAAPKKKTPKPGKSK